MRFRRKSAGAEAVAQTTPSEATESAPEETAAGQDVPMPRDYAEIAGDEVERVDLGGVLVTPSEGNELRLQVDETTGNVQSVMLAGEDGALEFAAFAAPRNGSLWNEIRPDIVGDLTARGAQVVEADGPWGAELHVSAQVQLPDGQVGVQETRIVGINGPRWMLRASFMGAPARDPEAAALWEARVSDIVVNRGSGAMPVGAAIEVRLPDQARRVQ